MTLYNTGFDPMNVFVGGFGVTETFFQKDGVVKYGPLEQGYKGYITMMAQWYQEDLIDPDFASNKNFLPAQDYSTTEKTGAFYEQYLDLSMLKSRSDNPNYNAVAVSTPRVNAEDELHVCQTSFEVGSSAWIITVSCQDHVLASSGAITPTRWKAICWLPTARKICAGPIMRLAIQNSPSICTTILTT